MLNGGYIEKSINGASTICGFVCMVVTQHVGSCDAQPIYWHPLLAEETVTCSLPHAGNEHQRSVNDFQLGILSNLSSD